MTAVGEAGPAGDDPPVPDTEAGTPFDFSWKPEIAPTRAAAMWMRVAPAIVVLAIGVVFVAQNTKDAHVRFLILSGTVPLAVALLGALVLGAAIVALVGTIRIHQLRSIIVGKRRPHSR